MISKLTAFAGGIIFSVVSLGIQAGEALEEFTSMLTSLNSMETEFSQVTMDQNGEVLQSLSGTLSVQRPGKMRWKAENLSFPMHFPRRKRRYVAFGCVTLELEYILEVPFAPTYSLKK